jgi:hypothetical protein
MAIRTENHLREKPTPPKTRTIHYPGLFEFAKDWDIDVPWTLVITATITFLISLFFI